MNSTVKVWSPLGWFIAGMLLAGVSINLLSNCIEDLCFKPPEQRGPLRIVGLCVFSVGAAWGTWMSASIARRALLVHTRSLHKVNARRGKVLVLFLSKVENPERLSPPVSLTGNLRQDVLAINRHQKVNEQYRIIYPWAQPLRGIEHQLGAEQLLERVVILASEESVAQLPQFFDEWLAPYLRLDPRTNKQLRAGVWLNIEHPCPLRDSTVLGNDVSREHGWDFEEFDDLVDTLQRLIGYLCLKFGYQESDIILAFTGGQKSTSVAAAIVTINRPVANQYVATQSERFYEPDASGIPQEQWKFPVWGYDLAEDPRYQD